MQENTEYLLIFAQSTFTFLLEFVMASSMTGKTLNKSFQDGNNFFFGGGGGRRGSKYQAQIISFSLNFSLKKAHLSTHILKVREFSTGLYLMERRNTCLAIRKLLV